MARLAQSRCHLFRGSPNGYGANGSTIIFKMETGIVNLGACLGCVSFSGIHLLWRMQWELRRAWYPTRAGSGPGPKLLGPVHGPGSWALAQGLWPMGPVHGHGSWALAPMGHDFQLWGVAASTILPKIVVTTILGNDNSCDDCFQ